MRSPGHIWRVLRRVGLAESASTLARKVLQPMLEAPRSKASGWRASRYAMYSALQNAAVRAGAPPGGVHLSISHSERLIEIVGLRGTVRDCSWPDFDLCDLAVPDQSVDSIVSDQVLEHLHGSPFDALRESARVLKPGGLIVHTTVFSHHLHPKPYDHWRFSPQGLARLADSAGLVTLELGGNGNDLIRWFSKSRWLWLIDVPRSRLNPIGRLLLRDDGRLPSQVWIVAQKPAQPTT